MLLDHRCNDRCQLDRGRHFQAMYVDQLDLPRAEEALRLRLRSYGLRMLRAVPAPTARALARSFRGLAVAPACPRRAAGSFRNALVPGWSPGASLYMIGLAERAEQERRSAHAFASRVHLSEVIFGA